MPRPTLASLAKELGVSRQTISNVLNAPHRVKPATRDRVKAAIDAAGYRPSAAARQLRTHRSMNLGMRLLPATDGINGSILDRFLHSVTESAQAAGYRLTLFCADSNDDEVRQYEQLLDVAGLDGFILTSSSPNDIRTRWLEERGTPFAVFGRPWDEETSPAWYPWVDVDGAAGTADAVVMLSEQGHSSIGFLGGSDSGPVARNRRAGWERAMRASGLAGHVANLSAASPDTIADGISGGRELAAKGATAIVCSSDSLAIGALDSLRELHPSLLIPGERNGSELQAAVVGFDDTPVAAALGLSSVAQPIEDVARHIIRLLTYELALHSEGDVPPDNHLLLAPRVVERVPLHVLIGRQPRG